MVLERTLVERHGADEQIALVDGARGRGECRRDEYDLAAGGGSQCIGDRADIAGVGRIEGRADLEHHVAGAPRAQPVIGGAGELDRLPSRNRAALEGDHDGVHLGKRQVGGRHADRLDGAQPASGQRVGKIGGAGIVVGDRAERERHAPPPEGGILPACGANQASPSTVLPRGRYSQPRNPS